MDSPRDKGPETRFFRRLGRSAAAAFPPALRTALWLIKLTLPITLGIAILNYLGVVDWIGRGLAPLFALAGLPGEGALVFLTGALGNLYSAIGVMATLGVDLRAGTILAVMGLICHNLIIETAIQRRAGAVGWRIVVLRVAMAFVAGIGLNWLLPEVMEGRMMFGAAPAEAHSWAGLLQSWAMTIAPLVAKMVVLILSLNIIQSWLREFGVLRLIAYPLRPAMRIFGLPLSTSFLWIICNVIGLTYGGAAIIDEVARGEATADDAHLLNTHVAISHSLLEDTVIFVSIGLGAFWLTIPRLVLATAAVWGQRAASGLGKEKYSVKTT